jgi:hypothetical protein
VASSRPDLFKALVLEEARLDTLWQDQCGIDIEMNPYTQLVSLHAGRDQSPLPHLLFSNHAPQGLTATAKYIARLRRLRKEARNSQISRETNPELPEANEEKVVFVKVKEGAIGYDEDIDADASADAQDKTLLWRVTEETMDRHHSLLERKSYNYSFLIKMLDRAEY